MALFKNKYRIESARLKDWDYSSDAAYYITICADGMKNYFGKIANDKVVLSRIGKIVKQEWLNTSKIRKNVFLDEFIIMPNHLHGIILIMNDDQKKLSRRGTSTLKSGSIGAIIGQFKSKVTKRIQEIGYSGFKWQTRFYDHIIGSEKALNNIREYIRNNPIKWQIDKYYRL